MTMQELTRPLRRGLGTLRRRVRALLLVLGISRVVAALIVVLIAFFLADYFLRLPLAVRRTITLLVAAGLAFEVFRRIVRPLTRPLSDRMLAGRVEALHPDLESRLSSSIAFCDAKDDPENEDSPELMRTVVE